MTSKKSPRQRGEHLYRVQVLVRQRRYRIFSTSVAAFCTDVLQALRQPPSFLGVTFIGVMKMRQLNRKYRGLDRPTDVLSFAYEEESVEDGLPFLGDIVLSPEVAFRQAARWRTDPDTEIRKLLLHGLLHLLGYDHETDHGEMDRLQRRFMRLRIFRGSSPLVDIRESR